MKSPNFEVFFQTVALESSNFTMFNQDLLESFISTYLQMISQCLIKPVSYIQKQLKETKN